MLQQAMSTVLDDRLLDDDELYPNGNPVQIFDVSVSPCLRYATFFWGVPLQADIEPTAYQQQSKRDARDHDAVEHLSPADAQLVRTTAAALNRCASRLKQLMVPRIRVKVCASVDVVVSCCGCGCAALSPPATRWSQCGRACVRRVRSRDAVYAL